MRFLIAAFVALLVFSFCADASTDIDISFHCDNISREKQNIRNGELFIGNNTYTIIGAPTTKSGDSTINYVSADRFTVVSVLLKEQSISEKVLTYRKSVDEILYTSSNDKTFLTSMHSDDKCMLVK